MLRPGEKVILIGQQFSDSPFGSTVHVLHFLDPSVVNLWGDVSYLHSHEWRESPWKVLSKLVPAPL